MPRRLFQFIRSFAVLALAWTCLGGEAARAAGAPLAVVYPRPASADDMRAVYYIKLLDLVLKTSGQPYTLGPYALQTVGARMVQKIAEDAGINVIWAPTSREFEQVLQAVPIPIDKGLLGWRLLLINQRDRPLFAQVHRFAQLQALSAGQQHDWADTSILRANGMKVVEAINYEGMFQMLAADRYQYFPRGVGEIWGEMQGHAELGIEVEPHLALHYPTATYFFVRKGNTVLAQALERGLRAAIKDGSLDRLFERYNGELLRKAHLETRTVFELSNPLLPEGTPPQPRDELLRRPQP